MHLSHTICVQSVPLSYKSILQSASLIYPVMKPLMLYTSSVQMLLWKKLGQ